MRLSPLSVTTFVGFLGCFTAGGFYPAYAQVPITASGLNTQVSAPQNLPNGKVQHDISGGTRPGNGLNLFHSFGEFGVPNNNIANFLNDSGLATSNILSRVTGGNPSNIFGMIQTTGFGNANLFLMNPAGILFGPNATLNVGGSVHFTTADYLRLNDGTRFNAVPGAQDALLSTAPVAAFGFLASSPAAISVQGSALSVPLGESISLVGGDISIQGGLLKDGTSQPAHLAAPRGQIRLASVASSGEVLHPTLETAPNIDGQTFSTMGTITISENATIDVSGDAAGTVIVRGGQLIIADSTISADTRDTNGTSPAVDINLTGDMSISNDNVSGLTARTSGAGDAGEVRISSANLTATSNTLGILTLIDTHTSGAGKAGNVSISTGNLQMTGSFEGFAAFIDTGTEGPGHGGDVTITGRNMQIDVSLISTGTFVANSIFGGDATGSAGNVTVSADSLNLAFSTIATDAFSLANGTGQSGNFTITAHEINLDSSQISVQGHERGGTITITTDQLLATNFSKIVTQTALAPGGGVTLIGRVIELSDGSTIVSSTAGDGDAGHLNVIATDHLNLFNPGDDPSGLFSNSFGTFGSAGNAGNILVTTPKLEMTGGSRINTTTASSGHGGDVTVNTTGSISMSGETGGFAPEPLFSLGTIQPSGIFTLTIGGHCSGKCGNAGSVSISTGSLTMGGGAQINSGTQSTGQGGVITVNAANTIAISGTLGDGSPAGILSRTIGSDPASGHGGDISLTAGGVQLSNGASVSAQSSGPGNAGNITITATDAYISRDGTVTTSTTQSDGGNIAIKAGNLVQLVDSQITTNVQGGVGSGGNISIDPPTVIIERSNIIASAIGGNGGNINIVAGVLLVSPDSLIDASSTFGLSGTITIESPITNLSGTLAPLPQGFVQPAAFAGRCAARIQGGPNSSLVVRTSRDRIPAEPGELLLSPLFASTQDASVAQRSNDSNALRAGLTGFPVPAGCPS